jgi:hypothetical protein
MKAACSFKKEKKDESCLSLQKRKKTGAMQEAAGC